MSKLPFVLGLGALEEEDGRRTTLFNEGKNILQLTLTN